MIFTDVPGDFSKVFPCLTPANIFGFAVKSQCRGVYVPLVFFKKFSPSMLDRLYLTATIFTFTKLKISKMWLIFIH